MCFFQSQEKISDADSCMQAASLCRPSLFHAKEKHRKGALRFSSTQSKTKMYDQCALIVNKTTGTKQHNHH
jgi:hypothetical protein